MDVTFFAAVGRMAFEETGSLAAWAKRLRDFKRFCPCRGPKEADGLFKGCGAKGGFLWQLDYEFPGRGFCRPGAIEKGQINLQLGSHVVSKAGADVRSRKCG